MDNTKIKTDLFYGSIASLIVSALSLAGYLFSTSGTILSRGSMALFILFALGSLGSAGYYYYLKTSGAQTYIVKGSSKESECGC